MQFFLVLFKLFLCLSYLLYLIGVLIKLDLLQLLLVLLQLVLLLEVFLVQDFILCLHLGDGLLLCLQ